MSEVRSGPYVTPRLPARTAGEKLDHRVRCRFCDQGILPGEVFDKPRECCEEGRAADTKHLAEGRR